MSLPIFCFALIEYFAFHFVDVHALIQYFTFHFVDVQQLTPFCSRTRPGSGCLSRRKIRDWNRSRDHHALIAEMEHSYDLALDPILSTPVPHAARTSESVTIPSPPPLLQPPLPVPPSVHRGAVRRLPLMEGQSAARSPPLPNADRAARFASDEKSPVSCAGALSSSESSPLIHCSQYRVMQHQEENHCQANVADWIAKTSSETQYNGESHDEGFYDSGDSSSESSYGGQSAPAKIFHQGKLLVHRDYDGRIPLCFYPTGLQEGGPHDYYECFDKRDILWARRVRFHIDRMRKL